MEMELPQKPKIKTNCNFWVLIVQYIKQGTIDLIKLPDSPKLIPIHELIY